MSSSSSAITTTQQLPSPGKALRDYNTKEGEVQTEYLKKYENSLFIHKRTDMIHDGLQGEGSDPMKHFDKVIPENLSTSIADLLTGGIDDTKFIKQHILLCQHGRIIEYSDLSNFISIIVENAGNIANFSIKVCHYKLENNTRVPDTDNVIYEYTQLRYINYDAKNADDFTTTLDIKNNSILNVDFQYDLWKILKSGEEVSKNIYLKKTSENENDPAGKFSIKNSIFKNHNGVNIWFLINDNDGDVTYIPYSERFDKNSKLVDVETPDFFSSFKVTLGPLKQKTNLFGFFEKYITSITITKEEKNFKYFSDSKQDNSNTTVKKKILRFFRLAERLRPNDKENVLESAACEVVKKGSGDELQLLSQRNTKERNYTIIQARNGSSERRKLTEEHEEFFVSHDLPTCVRNLLEGNNLILMHGITKTAISFKLNTSKPVTALDNIKDLINYITRTDYEKIMKNLGLITHTEIVYYKEKFIEKFEEVVVIYNDKLSSLSIEMTSEIMRIFIELRSKSVFNFDEYKVFLKNVIYLCNFKRMISPIDVSGYTLTRIEKETINNWMTHTVTQVSNMEVYVDKLRKILQLQNILIESFTKLSQLINVEKIVKITQQTNEYNCLNRWNINWEPRNSRYINNTIDYNSTMFLDIISENLNDTDDASIFSKKNFLDLHQNNNYFFDVILNIDRNDVMKRNLSAYYANLIMKLSLNVSDRELIPGDEKESRDLLITKTPDGTDIATELTVDDVSNEDEVLDEISNLKRLTGNSASHFSSTRIYGGEMFLRSQVIHRGNNITRSNDYVLVNFDTSSKKYDEIFQLITKNIFTLSSDTRYTIEHQQTESGMIGNMVAMQYGGAHPHQNKYNYVLLNNLLLSYSFDTNKIINNPFLHKFTLHLILSKRIADTLLNDSEISIEIHNCLFYLFFMNNDEKECNELLQKAFGVNEEIAYYLSIIHNQNLYRICGGSLVFPEGFNKKVYFDNILRIITTEKWYKFKSNIFPNNYVIDVYKKIERVNVNDLITFMNCLSYDKGTDFSISYITEKITNLKSARRQKLNRLVKKLTSYNKHYKELIWKKIYDRVEVIKETEEEELRHINPSSKKSLLRLALQSIQLKTSKHRVTPKRSVTSKYRKRSVKSKRRMTFGGIRKKHKSKRFSRKCK